MAKTLFDRVGAFEARLHAFLAAPPRSSHERAVYDAWKAAIQPRARRMLARAARLADAQSWEYDEARRPLRLRANLWTRTVRDGAALYVELAGALLQHEHVRLVWRPKVRFGAVRGSHTAPVTAKTKAKAQEAARKALESARKAEWKAAKKVLDEVLAAWAKTREALRESLSETRHLVAALQEAEELRLQVRIRALEEGGAEREHAEDLLLDLAQGRLNAARYGEERPAGYGSLLRRAWLQPRARLVRVLEG